MLIVQVCPFSSDAQGYYRCHEPGRWLSRIGPVVIDCDPFHRLLPLLVGLADVLVLHWDDWEWLPILQRRRALGKITVFEANDDYFDIQPWNPGSVRWADAFEQEKLRCLLQEADAVQTTTAVLAQRFGPWARRVAVFANQLSEIPLLEDPPARPLTIGWAGSGSHLADWYALCPALEHWLLENRQVHVAVMTHETGNSFLRLPPDRYHFHPPGSLAEYLTFLRSLDIGLAPLIPTDFNRARSDLKYLEYASQGVPGIYSDLDPFRASIRDGVNGFLFSGPEQLTDRLDCLIGDASLRQKIRQRAHHEICSQRLLSQHVAQRLQFYAELGATSQNVDLPSEILAASTREGNYLQLRPGEPERVLVTAIESPSDPRVLPALEKQVGQHPLYEAGLQQLGYLLNEANAPSVATDYLERALGLDPDSPRALCESARSLAELGQFAEARARLERALTLVPGYPLAWNRLLRLLGLGPSEDAPCWARRALDHYTRSLRIFLAALPLFAPADRLPQLVRFLDMSEVAPQEPAEARAALSRVIGECLEGRLHDPESLILLRRAVAVLPESARLTLYLADALERSGDLASAHAHRCRGLVMCQQAEVCGLEFARDDPFLKRSMVAAYAQEVRAVR